MPIRIGGTTQDRATYDPDLKGYVSYSVNDPLEAPMNLTYGPKFFDLISMSTSYILADLRSFIHQNREVRKRDYSW